MYRISKVDNRGSFQTIEAGPFSKDVELVFFYFFFFFIETRSDWFSTGRCEVVKELIPPRTRGKSIIEAFFFFFNYLMDLAYREECFS